MKPISTTTKVLGAGALATVLFLALRPSTAKAAEAPTPKPPKPAPTTKRCPDGSEVAVTSTCPALPAPPNACVEVSAAGNTAPAPIITELARGVGAPSAGPLLPIGLPFSLEALPKANFNEPCIKAPSDGLVFIQGWNLGSGYQPVFQDPPSGAPAAATITTGGDPLVSGQPMVGAQRALNKDFLMGSPTSPLSNYFDPTKSADVAKLFQPGSFVLVWTTTTTGTPIAWWLMNWSMA